MEKVEAVLGGPLAMGGPGYGALKREGGGDEWKYQKRGGGVALSLAFPMFWFPGVERGGWCVPLVLLWHVLFVCWRGGGGGMVGYKVATLGMMLWRWC